jgi:hypothetical protein
MTLNNHIVIPQLRVFRTPVADQYATVLFKEAFNSEFPKARACTVKNTDITVDDWYQYVALYTWPDGAEECVGFCNWIKYENVYLEGGLAVQKGFYRQLDKVALERISKCGGLAQIIMEVAAVELTDCVAWFGYCGDARALKVDMRVGYVKTDHPYLIVRWVKSILEHEQAQLIDEIKSLGPF